MSLKSDLNSIINSGNVIKQHRILTIDIPWPDGEPPYSPGTYVNVPVIPETPSVYGVDEFDKDSWFDVTKVVKNYTYNQDSDMQINQLSLSIVGDWDSLQVEKYFREMRAIVVQESYSNEDVNTGWFNVCWCISEGFAAQWGIGNHGYTVNAKDVLSLLNMTPLADDNGLVFEPSKIDIGSPTGLNALSLVRDNEDDLEYGYINQTGAGTCTISTDQYGGFIIGSYTGNIALDEVTIRNTASGICIRSKISGTMGAPATRFFIEDTVNLNTALTYTFIIGQIQPNWCDRPAPQFFLTNVPNYTVNVPVSVGDNAVQGVFSEGLLRLSKNWVNGTQTNSDLSKGLGYTTLPSTNVYPTIAGYFKRYAHPVMGTLPADSGEYNSVVSVITSILLRYGFQNEDETRPLYIENIESPTLDGLVGELTLPVMVIAKDDSTTAAEFIENLRKSGFVPPNYYVLGTADGNVITKNVSQNNAGYIPITKMKDLSYDRNNLDIYTKVLARGLYSVLPNIASSAILTDVSSGNGGLIDPSSLDDFESKHNHSTYPLTNLTNTHKLASTAMDYNYFMPWFWRFKKMTNADGDVISYLNLIDNWNDKYLCELDFGTDQVIDKVELEIPVITTQLKALVEEFQDIWTHYSDPPLNHLYRQFILKEQILQIDYLDGSEWKVLISNIASPRDDIDKSKLIFESTQFDTRSSVYTSKLRVKCVQPFVIEGGLTGPTTWGENYSYYDFYEQILFAAFLWLIKVYPSPEIQQTAEIGVDSPFTGQYWIDNKKRLRTRKYIMEEAVPWLDDATKVKNMAIAWLKDKVRDLAPRAFSCIRPDLNLWDTIRLTDPVGHTNYYLVTGVTKSSEGICQVLCVNYTAPYVEEQ